MIKNILTVGFPRQLIEALAHRDDLNFYVLEEEELYRNNRVAQYEYPIMKEVILTEYMHSEAFKDIVRELDARLKFSAVIPARDYAVRASATIAEMLGLPGLGEKAARCLTHKALLREICAEYNIPHPRFKKIESLKDLQEFVLDKPVIFKPANRQASLGISKIERREDIPDAWEYTTSAQEDGRRIVSTRQIPKEYIAEEYIEGFEVSIESFVQGGHPIFHNITVKTTGENFIELQHVAPGDLDPALQDSLIQHKENFIRALSVQDGTLHSEWKIDNGSPYIIECAGRTPGDCIVDLISESYQFNFYNEFCNLLCGETPQIQNHPTRVSAIRFFTPHPGVLKEIQGLETLQQPDIIAFNLTVKPGDTIAPLRSSWDRVGYFIVTAQSHKDLNHRIEDVLKQVTFVLEEATEYGKESDYAKSESFIR
ncbi:ATP-grasp domain-containing protein [Paenibacillus ihumii]|uniref:ATP-grasp domain-containing protein n=1 Tax=Paenibacillus ihumii TaxID=687436 RepID=UPI0006D862E4|nr:ATP-grasp domain-containing protein [Paenibacillus ihumii]